MKKSKILFSNMSLIIQKIILKIFRIQGSTVIGLCVNIAYLLSTLIYPYMPNVSANIRKQLNLPVFSVTTENASYDSDNIKPDVYSYPVFFNKFFNFVKEGHHIGKSEPLFKRIMDADVKVWKEKFGGVQEKRDEKNPKDKKQAKKEPKQPKPEGEKKEKKKSNRKHPNQLQKITPPNRQNSLPLLQMLNQPMPNKEGLRFEAILLF